MTILGIELIKNNKFLINYLLYSDLPYTFFD
jgi:hypothetical protein